MYCILYREIFSSVDFGLYKLLRRCTDQSMVLKRRSFFPKVIFPPVILWICINIVVNKKIFYILTEGNTSLIILAWVINVFATWQIWEKKRVFRLNCLRYWKFFGNQFTAEKDTSYSSTSVEKLKTFNYFINFNRLLHSYVSYNFLATYNNSKCFKIFLSIDFHVLYVSRF